MHSQTQDHALRVVAKLPEDEVPDGDLALPIKAVVIKQVHEGTRLLSTRVTIMAWHGREWRCGCCTSKTRNEKQCRRFGGFPMICGRGLLRSWPN
jgi:hypothetical protein